MTLCFNLLLMEFMWLNKDVEYGTLIDRGRIGRIGIMNYSEV